MTPSEPQPTKPETVLVLRTCNADLTSHNGFRWPEYGLTEAPDWNPEPICGYGLHGLLWGEGDAGHLNLDSNAKWLVVEVETSTLVDLSGKVKFPRGNVVHCGTKESTTAYLVENGARGRKVVFATLTGGDRSTLTGGNESTLTGGNESTLIVRWWDGSAQRYRAAAGDVGPGDLKPGVPYRFVKGEWVEQSVVAK